MHVYKLFPCFQQKVNNAGYAKYLARSPSSSSSSTREAASASLSENEEEEEDMLPPKKRKQHFLLSASLRSLGAGSGMTEKKRDVVSFSFSQRERDRESNRTDGRTERRKDSQVSLV